MAILPSLEDSSGRGNRIDQESGFILVTAIWMLLLAAAIVSLIMLHNMRRAEIISFDEEMTKRRFAMESAVETVIADMMFNGPRSKWAQLPSQNSYQINGINMTVSVSSESGKLDLNRADPALVARALQGLGVSAISRTAFVGELKKRRKEARLFQIFSDASRALQKAGVKNDDSFCSQQYFTVYSGLTRPRPNQMSAELSKALGRPSLASSSPVSFGTAILIEVEPEKGSALRATVRVTGSLVSSYEVLDWQTEDGC